MWRASGRVGHGVVFIWDGIVFRGVTAEGYVESFCPGEQGWVVLFPLQFAHACGGVEQYVESFRPGERGWVALFPSGVEWRRLAGV